MKPTTQNLRRVIAKNFSDYIDMDDDVITKTEGDIIYISSKHQGLNAAANLDDPDWEETIIRHVKWQLGL